MNGNGFYARLEENVNKLPATLVRLKVDMWRSGSPESGVVIVRRFQGTFPFPDKAYATLRVDWHGDMFSGLYDLTFDEAIADFDARGL
jgi:hypothetical protein